MYKRTSDSSHFLPRTGSHSTKGARNGRVDVLPPSATSQMFFDLKDRRDALLLRLKEAEKKLGALNHERDSLSVRAALRAYSSAMKNHKEFGAPYPKEPPILADLNRRFATAKKALHDILSQLNGLQSVGDVKKLRQQTFAEIFVALAAATLDEPTFQRLKMEAKERLRIATEKPGDQT